MSEKVKITFDILYKIQEIYREYDAVRKIIQYVKPNIALFNEFIKIQSKWVDYPSNDSLLEIMYFLEGQTEIEDHHYEITDDYKIIAVKN